MTPPTSIAKPIATATIEPIGLRGEDPREHLIKVELQLSSSDGKHGEKGKVADLARRSLDGFPAALGQPDRRGAGDLLRTSKTKAGVFNSVVIGVEASVVSQGRPAIDAVEGVRASLHDDGYRVAVREKRECAETRCTSLAVVDWDRPAHVPAGWYSGAVCGKHNYRTCLKCKSVYVMTSTNAAGQAPALPCEVCGVVMVEWGSSKIWDAKLVTRGASAR